MLLRRLILANLAALLLGITVAAATDFDRAVLARMSREQIITYLRAADADLNDDQRGAKYMWGSVPLDREPPHYLGLWWVRLTPAEREEKMVAWFRGHSNAIALADVRARLEIGGLVDEVRAQRGPDPAHETVPWWMARPAAGSDTPVRVIPPRTATDSPNRSANIVARPQHREAPAATTPASAGNAGATGNGQTPVPAAGAPPRTGTAAGERPPAPPLRVPPGMTVPTTTTNTGAVDGGNDGSAGTPPVTGGDAPPVVHRTGLPVTLRNDE